MKRSVRTLLLFFLVLMLILVLAACGDEPDEETGSVTTASSTTKVPPATTEVLAASTTAATATATPTTTVAASTPAPVTTTLPVTTTKPLPTYTVAFDPANGEAVTIVSVSHGERLTPPTPSRVGYEIVGWLSDGEAWDMEDGVVTADLTLVAEWEAITYTITYLLGDATPPAAGNPTSYTVEDEFLLENPTKHRYEFSGWRLNGSVVSEIPKGTTGNLVLYAEWEPINYSITYELNGGTIDPLRAPDSYYFGYIFTLPKPTREGYRFTGWTKDGVSVTGNNSDDYGDITFVAHWEPISYTIKYWLDPGMVIEGECPLTYTIEDEITLPTVSVTGRQFSGWILICDWGTYGNIGQTIPEGMVGNITLLANCEPIRYHITYSIGCGGVLPPDAPTEYTAEDSIEFLSTPVRPGYIFLNWTMNGKPVYYIPEGTTGDLTLEAVYEPIFTLSGGEITGLTAKGKRLCEIEIPSEIDGVKITSIGEGAFEFNDHLERITVPDTVTTIKDKAFYYCQILLSATIPDSVTEFGEQVFARCRALENVTLTKSITSIPAYTFYGCFAITEFEISDGIKTIGVNAFSDCTALKSLTIPPSLTDIGEKAFNACDALEGVYISDLEAWCRIEYNGSASSPLMYAKNLYLSGALVTDVVIPATIESIHDYSFYCCQNLTSVTIHANVKHIGERAFRYCPSLRSITVDAANSEYRDIDGNLYTKDGATLMQYAVAKEDPDFVAPEGLSKINAFAFYGCQALRTLTLGSTVTEIGSYAFKYCEELSSVTICASQMSLGSGIFECCPNFTYASADASVFTIIPTSALQTAVITGGTMINMYEFYGAKNLTSVTISNTVTGIAQGAFSGCTGLTSVVIPNSIEFLGQESFYGCSSLTMVVIPDSVTSIGEDAFTNCPITHATVSAMAIPDIANINLQTLVITSGTSIDAEVLSGCTALESVTIPGSVESIGESAFYGCTSLNAVHIEDLAGWCEITFVNEAANPLYYAGNIYCGGSLVTNLVIPDGVTAISDFAFLGCSGLTSLELAASVESIGDYTFAMCSGIRELVTSDTLLSIGMGAFLECTGLESVTIGMAVTTIGSHAFGSCRELKSAIFKDGAVWHADNIVIVSFDLADTETAATYLTDTHKSRIWTKR